MEKFNNEKTEDKIKQLDKSDLIIKNIKLKSKISSLKEDMNMLKRESEEKDLKIKRARTELIRMSQNLGNEMKKMKDLQSLFEEVMETVDDPVLVVDDNTKKIVEVNSSTQEMLGIPEKDIVGKKLSKPNISAALDPCKKVFTSKPEVIKN